MAQLSLEMAIAVAHTHAYDPALTEKARPMTKRHPLDWYIDRLFLKESKEYPSGWSLLFRPDTSVDGDFNMTVFVRDDDVVYFFGLSPRSVIAEIVGLQPARPNASLEEQFLSPQGDNPRLYRGDIEYLPPPRR